MLLGTFHGGGVGFQKVRLETRGGPQRERVCGCFRFRDQEFLKFLQSQHPQTLSRCGPPLVPRLNIPFLYELTLAHRLVLWMPTGFSSEYPKEIFFHRTNFPAEEKSRPNGRLIINGDSGIRTHDLLNAIQALSQLSYTPMSGTKSIIAQIFGFVNHIFSFLIITQYIS